MTLYHHLKHQLKCHCKFKPISCLNLVQSHYSEYWIFSNLITIKCPYSDSSYNTLLVCLLKSTSILAYNAWSTEASAKAIIDIIIGWKAILLKDFLANPVWMDEHAKVANVTFFLPDLCVVHAILTCKAECSINAYVDIFHTSKNTSCVVRCRHFQLVK